MVQDQQERRHQIQVASSAGDNAQRPCSLPDVLQEVPHLIHVLHRKSRSALSGCNTQLRHIFHSCTTVVLIKSQSDLQTLAKGYWPQLAVVVLRKEHFDTSRLCEIDNIQLVAVLDLRQRYRSKVEMYEDKGKCSVLLVASNEGQQQTGLIYSSTSVTAASKYLSPRCTEVDELALWRKNGTWGIVQLALINWCSLGILDLREGKLEPVDMMYLMKAPLSQVHYLFLSCNHLGSEGIKFLVSAHLPHLCTLRLCNTQLDTAAAQHLSKGDWPNLARLHLSGNSLDDMAMIHIADGHWPELQDLQIDGNPIGALGFQRLIKGSWPKLNYLTVVPTMLSPASLALLDIHAMPCVPTGDFVICSISRNLAEHDRGQPLIWPHLKEFVCVVIPPDPPHVGFVEEVDCDIR